MFNEMFLALDSLQRWHMVAIISVGYLYYYLREVVKQPVLVVSKGPFQEFLYKNVPTLKLKFWPTFWCVESRAQTVFASILRSNILPYFKYRREILTLKDGGEVALDWMEVDCQADSPLILILPGLTGASQAEYIKCLVFSAKKIGIRTVVFNNRGLGGLSLKTQRLYCAASFDDLSEVIQHVRKNNPNVKLGATGISMGGLILGNYLVHCEEAHRNITAAQIISVPWNVKLGCASLEKPYLNNWLGQHLAGRLCKTLSKCKVFDDSLDYDMAKILQSKTIKEFDENFTTKHFGYDNVDHYYSAASLHDKLHKISVPCLCLSAADDPFQPLEAIPVDNAEKSTHIAICITARGGHIGFLEGCWPNSKNQYMGRLFSEFFGAVFKNELNFQNTSAQMIKAFNQQTTKIRILDLQMPGSMSEDV